MSAKDRLDHWRDQYRQIVETMNADLPFHSIAQPVLEQDLATAKMMIAHYEALVAKGDPETGPA